MEQLGIQVNFVGLTKILVTSGFDTPKSYCNQNSWYDQEGVSLESYCHLEFFFDQNS